MLVNLVTFDPIAYPSEYTTITEAILTTYFADILLPVAVQNLFTYRIPMEMEGKIVRGMRVVVPFGKHKLSTGIVVELHAMAPRDYQAKYIDSILDDYPVVNGFQLKFWEWMAQYYLCARGEVLLAALPIGLRLSSETKFVCNPAFDGEASGLEDKDLILLNAIQLREVVKFEEVPDILGIKTIQPILKRLLDAGAILVYEEIKERYKPKTEIYVRLTKEFEEEKDLEKAFRLVAQAQKQEEALMVFVRLSRRYTPEREEVKKSELIKHSGCKPGVIQALVQKKILETYTKDTSRIGGFYGESDPNISLTPVQAEATQSIKSAIQPVVLLHGVTSSGKTEIYSQLIKEVLAEGKQVLYILPEIALTTQMIHRLQACFGDQIAVYHSKFNQNERVEIWNTVLNNDSPKSRIVLGARSAIFLPFSNLGLIIVDEEHEASYKQMDPAPRYHARDSAIVLAAIHGAKTVLGSATPSYESMHNALAGKYGYVKILERFGGIPQPEIKAVLLNGKTAPNGTFTETLLKEIKETLDGKNQVILFQNRRGYAPVLVCTECGWTPECTRCDVSATYHKAQDRLLCHYCGSRYTMPSSCPVCGSHKLRLAGSGTERIEEELQIFFPDAKIERLDLDTTRTKMGYQTILDGFQEGEIDILIGTQMIAKGLDFSKVSLVGILNADLLLKYPEFRAIERGFQLMTQVAGRAGRRNRRGKVIIQSHDPNQWVIQSVIKGDFQAVYEAELKDRRSFGYPPFSRIILFIIRHIQSEMVDYCAAQYHRELLMLFPERNLLGPEYPPVKRVNNRFSKHIIAKINPEMNLKEVKRKLTDLNSKFFASKEFRAVRLIINVDPQ